MINVISIASIKCEYCGKELTKILTRAELNKQNVAIRIRKEDGWMTGDMRTNDPRTYCPDCKGKRRKEFFENRAKKAKASRKEARLETRSIANDLMKVVIYEPGLAGILIDDRKKMLIDMNHISNIDQILPMVSNERTRLVLSKYYDECMTMEEIGNEYSVTRERIRQIINKGLKQALIEMERAYEDKFVPKAKEINTRSLSYLWDHGELTTRTVNVMSSSLRRRVGMLHEPTIDDMRLYTENEVWNLRSMGKGSVENLKQAMKKYGVEFRMEGSND